MNNTVLISGASVAGPTLAFWLRRLGFRPTLVERAPQVRKGGHAIDLRGVALTVIDRMGLGAQARGASTRMRGMSMVDGDGNELMRTTESTLTGGAVGNEHDVELLRDDLVEQLARATRGDVECLFDDSITSIVPEGDAVRVSFAQASPRLFDLVVGADGLHSHVRALAFGDESQFVHHLGQYLAVFSAPNFLELDHWQVFHHGAEGMLGYYTARDNTEARVMMGFESPLLAIRPRDAAAQKAFLSQHFARMGWETARILAAMHDSTDFYFDAMSQVRMPAWHKGRVVLLGDAGYGPSPLSGQGTSLAVVGAYILAHALARSEGDHLRAFEQYSSRMRPFVEVNHQLALDALASRQPPSPEQTARAANAIAL